jgi:hypothetical protein
MESNEMQNETSMEGAEKSESGKSQKMTEAFLHNIRGLMILSIA